MELEALEKLNNDLKEQGYKFSCVVWRSNYQVRGTFIFEDGSTKRKRINLDVPADITRLNEARKRITELLLALNPPSPKAVARARAEWGITGQAEWER